MPMMTAARYLAESLATYGVTHLFYVPTMLSRMLAEMDDRTNIARVTTHGEKAAAYMADGYARASGRPGICMAQAIGRSNLAAGLRDAYMAHSPVIAFIGCSAPGTEGKTVYQQVDDDRGQFRPVTKWTARPDRAVDLPQALRQAFRVSTTGCPGPVALELPAHMGEIENEQADFNVEVEKRFAQLPPFRPAPDPDAVDEALRRIAAAQRPIIIAGGGARMSRAGEALRDLAGKLQIPVATSLNGKDLLPATDPLNAGVTGIYSRKCANRAVGEADLVIFAGSRAGSMTTCAWKFPPPGASVIQIDIDPQQPGRHYAGALPLLGDVRAALQMMLERSGTTSVVDRREWMARIASIASAWREEVSELRNSEAVPIRPERLCSALSRFLPPDALVVSDTGHAAMWTASFLDLNHPHQSLIRCAGSLGWGFPAALGAKLACPERPVVLFTGDGGFWYHVAELETAVRWGISTVLVVNNNQRLSQERDVYTAAYGGRLRGRHAELWHFTDVNLTRLAESFGARGVRVEKPSELDSALDQALSARGPFVVEVMTDPEAMAPLAWIGEGLSMGYSGGAPSKSDDN
jgi:acetolactate synthase-1/2/3 large subunit